MGTLREHPKNGRAELPIADHGAIEMIWGYAWGYLP